MMKTILLLVACLVACLPSIAQNVSSSLTVVLIDSTGAAIPGAECKLTSSATGTVYRSVSSTDGTVIFPTILAGNYTFSAEKSGFRQLVAKDIQVTASQVRSLGRLAMEIGEVRQAVNVTAEVSAVQLASAEKAGTITEEQLRDVALKGRDVIGLMTTIPGVVDNGSQRRETAARAAIGGLFVNGAREGQKNVTVDGITNMDTGSNTSMHYEPNMDAIAEVKILTSNYQAEYGRNAGGVITLITKSGTTSFHGSAYWFYRHESLRANNFFNNRTGTPNPPYRYRINGWSLGGPVFIPGKFNQDKSKLFFFFSQELVGSRVDYPTRLINVPTALERNGDFSRSLDVSGNLIPVRDPLTGQSFPGNVIPAARLNALGKSILNFYPTPNYTDPDPRNAYRWNYRSTYSGTNPLRQEIARVDWNPTPKWQMYYRMAFDHQKALRPYGYWYTGNLNYLLTPVAQRLPTDAHAVHVTNVLTPTLVNEFIIGRSQNALYFDYEDPSLVSRSLLPGLKRWYNNNDPGSQFLPDLGFGGQPANPVNSGLGPIPYYNWNPILSFVDNVSKIWGAHTVKAGFYVERTTKYQVGNGNPRGAFSFSRDVNNPFDSNHSFANALLGTMQSYTESTGRLDADYLFWNVEWYLQDNWRVSRRLTLDLGLRFYHVPPTTDTLGTLATFDPAFYSLSNAPALYVPARDPSGRRVAQDPRTGAYAPVPLIGQYVPGSGDYANGMKVGGKDGYPEGLYTTSALHLAPRFGFAYDIFGNGKTALRGGFGVFRDRLMGNPTYYAAGNPPITYSPVAYYSTLDTYAQSGGAVGPSDLRILFGQATPTTTMNFSFGIQHQLGGTVLDASYVGSQSRHLVGKRNINPIPMYARFDPANQDPTQPGRPLPDNFLRPIKGWGNIDYQEFGYNSNYNAFQFSVNRRMSRGLQFGAAYTWSKTLGTVPSEYDSVSPYFAGRSRNYGPLNFDRRQMLVFNYIYELPKIAEKIGVRSLRWVTDDWQISGITSFVDGAPFTPGYSTTDGADLTGSSEGARIDVIGDAYLPKGDRTFYRNFNTAAFARPAVRTFGTSGVNILTGPGINNWDITVGKRFRLGAESRYLQFRAEMYNAWNHTQFSGLFTNALFDPAGNQRDPNFGAFSSARDARIIQFSLRLAF